MSDIGSNWVKYDFLRQLFGKRAIRNTIEQRLARPNPVPYEYEKEEENTDDFFDYIMWYHSQKVS
ncbi:MAG TPA: hypothetical protein VJ729_07430 [Nitrososphaeraceae archaeon]|jgi:hypothetical protein|nr:hypothetical protein [Nitrososphaeraceae archaeon]